MLQEDIRELKSKDPLEFLKEKNKSERMQWIEEFLTSQPIVSLSERKTKKLSNLRPAGGLHELSMV